jgi:hypothetical protein
MGDISEVSILSAHAVNHKQGGNDPIRLDELATPLDNTVLNATIARHGLLPKLSNNAAQYLNGVGAFAAIPAGSVPAHASTHKSGGSDQIKLDELLSPDDNLLLNASTLKHGLLPKLGGGTTDFLRADGTWGVPSGLGSDLPPYVYDPFPSTYSVTVDGTLTPGGKWRVQYRGNRPDSPTDIGQVGVRVPASPTGGFARVFYEYPYLSTYTGAGTSASLVKTTTSYLADFDVTLSARLVDQRKSTPQVWESFWVMFRFNEAQGTNFHHYYVTFKTNGTIELGRKDRSDMVDEQRFLSTSATYTYALNAWVKIRIRAEGNHIQIWANDVLKIDLVDDGTLTDGSGTIPAPSSYMYQGLIGLYNEDAEVEFSPMTITELGSSSSVGAPDITNIIYVANDGSGDYLTLADALTTEGTKKKYVLGPGDHSLTTQLLTSLSNVVIQGSGVDVTRILFNNPSGESGFVVTGSLGPSRALTANAIRGAHTLTVGSGHGIVAGDWIDLYREVAMDSGTTRYDAEFHKVLSVTSTVITLEDTIYAAYNTSANAALYKVNWCNSFELSDLTMIDNRSTTTDLDYTADVLFRLCYNLRIRNVKFENMFYASCGIQSCFQTTVAALGFETPRATSDSAGIRYGLYLLSATSQFVLNGAWAQRCRHSLTTNNKSGTPPEAGRCRDISINGFLSFNADTAGFDTHESTVGIQFTSCGAYNGYPGDSTTTSKGFNTRSPATYNSCWVEGAYTQAFTLFNNADTVGTDDQPGADRTILNACRINNTSPPGGTNKGISISANRSSISITNCQFYNIEDANIEIEDGVSHVVIANCIHHSCGSGLSSSSGLIKCLGNVDDLIVRGNDYGAGTPAASGRPLYVATSVDGLEFSGNDCRGLTNKTPTIPAISTDVNIHDNPGLNPINKIATAFNTTNNTVGLYGGSTAAPTTATDYLVVGSDILVTVTGGTVSDITIKDGAGNTVASGATTLFAQHIPRGYKLRITHSSAPTVTVFAL